MDIVERKTYVGGSDLAAILGANPYRTQYEVWAEKVGLFTRTDAEQSEAAYWGTVLEPVLVQEYARRTGRAITLYPVPQVVHPVDSHKRGHPDAFVLDQELGQGILECKGTGFRHLKDWQNEDGQIRAPLYYRVQAQWYMHLTGLPWCSFAVLVGGNQFHWVDELPQPGFGAMAERAVDVFWKHVTSMTVPDTEPGDDLSLVYPKETKGKVVEAPDVLLMVPVSLRSVKERMAALKEEMKTLEGYEESMELLAQRELKDGEQMTWPDGTTFTWKLAKRKGYVVQDSEGRKSTWKLAKVGD